MADLQWAEKAYEEGKTDALAGRANKSYAMEIKNERPRAKAYQSGYEAGEAEVDAYLENK